MFLGHGMLYTCKNMFILNVMLCKQFVWLFKLETAVNCKNVGRGTFFEPRLIEISLECTDMPHIQVLKKIQAGGKICHIVFRTFTAKCVYFL